MSIRVAVVGVGDFGKNHARIYSEAEHIDLVAVVDTDHLMAERIAAMHGCKAMTDYKKVLDDVDVVSIVTPTTFHYGVAIDCLRAGKDILIEKPITSTVDEAEEIIAEADARKAIVQIGHLERYNPALLSAAGLVDNPLFIESERLSPFLGRGIDVDVTLDLMIHDVDIVMSLLKEPRVIDVKVVGAKVLTDKVDVAKAWIEFAGGTSALITASRIAGEKSRKLKVYLEDSFVLLDYMNMTVTRYYIDGKDIHSETIDVQEKEPLREEILDFIDCVKTRRTPKVTARDGKEALEVVLNITNKILHPGK